MSNPETFEHGDQLWVDSDNNWHREDGPAVIYADGRQDWYLNDKRHRVDGPAIIWADGTQEWWVRGTCLFSNKEFRRLSGISDEDMTSMVLKYGNVN